MRVQVTIDLDKLLSKKEARAAFESYFANFPPRADLAMERLGVDKKTFDEMLAYMVTKTILDDDGTGKNYRILGLAEVQKEGLR